MSNYDTARVQAAALFAASDPRGAARAWSLREDGSYMYLTMLAREYRIDLASGDAHCCGSRGWELAGYDESLVLYDALSRRGPISLSGRFVGVHAARGVSPGSQPGDELFARHAAALDRDVDALRRAFEKLGGESWPVGDAAARLRVLDEIPSRREPLFAVVQLWRADDEFPASVRVLWDENVLEVFKFETVFYAMGLIYDRLLEEMCDDHDA